MIQNFYRFYIHLFLTGTVSFLMVLTLPGQNIPLYKNPGMPVEARVRDLLSRMTPEEKFRQIFMIEGDLSIGKEKLKPGIFGLRISDKSLKNDPVDPLTKGTFSGSAKEMALKINEIQEFFRTETRLGIPVIIFDEALHGLVKKGATAFPQAIGLAAAFDTSLMHDVATAIAGETRSRGVRQVLSPVLNIARDVRWGRTEETYGEDPYLTAVMGSAFISGFENAGIIATPKHFAVNVGEGGRDSYPIHYNERILEEVYFPAFKSAFKNGHARSVMTAYNSLDGSPCSANDWLLNTKLKKEWGFRGFVISDACAVGGANVLHMTATGYEEAGKQAVENGLDVIFQTDFNHLYLFDKPFVNNNVDQALMDSAVARVLRVKFELGLFENPFVDPELAGQINGSETHHRIALKAARESMVLLKNEHGILPLGNQYRTIAVIGSDASEARLGGYSRQGAGKVSILEGMKKIFPQSSKLLFHPGCGRVYKEFQVIQPGYLVHEEKNQVVKGLRAEYYKDIIPDGKPAITRVDEKIDFSWTLYGPDPALEKDWFSVIWTGKILPPASGTFKIGIEGNDGYRLFLNGREVIDNSGKKSFGIKTTDFQFVKDSLVDIRLEYKECTGNSAIRLVWNLGDTDTLKKDIEDAVKLTGDVDLVVFVAGLEEGEFRDRSSLALPGLQEELLLKLCNSGKPVVVVLIGGSAIKMSNWIDKADAVLEAWYPGDEGGLAVAEVLCGRYNPAGRLPVTFPVAEGQLPLVYNHKPTGRGDDYLDLTGQPLFPFGFGLSYTEFNYSNLTIYKDHIFPGDTAYLSFSVTNSGKFAGDEVWQLYIRDESASVARPVKELKGFGRIGLAPGESKIITVRVIPEYLAMLDKNLKTIIEPGAFRLMIGASSGDIRLKTSLTIIKPGE